MKYEIKIHNDRDVHLGNLFYSEAFERYLWETPKNGITLDTEEIEDVNKLINLLNKEMVVGTE